jgi:hypothetical protein
VGGKLSQNELIETLDFCASAFDPAQPEEKERILQKLKSNGENINGHGLKESTQSYQDNFSIEEQRVINQMRARKAIDIKSTFDLDNFSTDVIDGMKVNLQRGMLCLVKVQ